MPKMIRLKLALPVFALLFAACGGSPTVSNNNSSAPTPAASPKPSLTVFEQDLQFIRNGQFTYVWIFSRKDGKVLDKTDNAFLKANAPQVVDWVLTDEGRKVIAGTNFNLEEGNLEKIKTRLVAEDYTGR
jgi:ABC-type glycerol-3-phosphate transport system substrate-binding protein